LWSGCICNRFKGFDLISFNSQLDYSPCLIKLLETIEKAYKVHNGINFEVFIHKVDGLSDEKKNDILKDIQKYVNEELTDLGLKVSVKYYLTSIYDHSIYEAFSRVIQSLIPQLNTLENLLDILVNVRRKNFFTQTEFKIRKGFSF
jgi:Ras-related GTP-binding protein C/D